MILFSVDDTPYSAQLKKNGAVCCLVVLQDFLCLDLLFILWEYYRAQINFKIHSK